MTRAPEPPAVGGVPASIAAIMAAIRHEVAAAPRPVEPAPAGGHPIAGVPTTGGEAAEVPFAGHRIPGVATAGPVSGGTAAVPHAVPALPAEIDAMTREMLAPLLKAWLDANLPEIVEAATRAEIRRLTGIND